jgi:hypothetical protein
MAWGWRTWLLGFGRWRSRSIDRSWRRGVVREPRRCIYSSVASSIWFWL